MGEQKNITCVASILMVTSGKVYILGQNAPICHTETKTFQKCIHIKYFLILSRLIYGGCVRIWESTLKFLISAWSINKIFLEDF